MRCLIMAQVEVEIVGSKSDLFACYKERIEQLFDVVIKYQPPCDTIVDDGNLLENRSFTIQLSSASSQENVQKATIFLRAVLEECRDFTTECITFTQKDFDMVWKASQAIERQSLAVVDFDFGAREVCMKGQQDNIKAAKLKINQLIMGPQNFSVKQSQSENSESDCFSGFLNSSALINRDSGVLPGKTRDLFSAHSRDVDNNVIVKSCRSDPVTMRSSSLVTDAEVDFPAIPGSDPRDWGGAIKSPTLSKSFAEAVSLKDNTSGTDMGKSQSSNDGIESMSDHSSLALSDEEGLMNMEDKSDPRYGKHLEFAVKLGYTERDLDRVIIRHGMECNEDKLLHELIENSAGAGHPESDITESISSSLMVPDITSSDVFLDVMQKVSKTEDSGSNLRHIVIDGSNVAMSHGKNVFSCRGIRIAVDWFKQRGHKEITVFVPQWRKESSRPDTPITDQETLTELEKEGIVVFTPARRIKGRRVVCYDDRFVLKLAADTNGIVVSNDNYRDLLNENKEYRTVVDERLLMYTFVNDRFMPPEDPLGRRGPTLDNFLCKEPTNPPSLPPECPYGRKCTYGNKCKYHHPERGSQPHKTVTEVLKEQAILKMQERAAKGPEPIEKPRRGKPKLARTRSLAPGEAVSNEKTLSPSTSMLQEADSSDSVNRQKSPTRSSGKTANYLSEHRKKLEEIMAHCSAADTSSKEQSSPRVSGPIAPPSHTQEVLSPVPALGSRVCSPSHLNVPYSSSQEGQLVRGHLLLAKKLSDEASESSFFSESSSNRASPVGINSSPALETSAQYGRGVDRVFDRRPSLQDHQQRPQPYYPFQKDTDSGLANVAQGSGAHLPSQQGFQHMLPAYGAQCQSYPSTEKESGHSVLRRLMSYREQLTGPVGLESAHREHMPLKSQYSCPPTQFPPSPAPFSGHPFGGMVRQNSSSDPQLHMTGSGESTYSPWHSTATPPPHTLLEPRGGRSIYGSSSDQPHRSASELQQLYRSMSVEPYKSQQSYGSHSGLDRQISEVLLGSPQDLSLGVTLPYMAHWEMGGGMYHSHPTTPTHHPHSLPPRQGLHQSGGMSSWSQGPMPPPPLPVSPVKSQQQQQQQQQASSRSFPANQPIPPTDPRFSLYYNLCGIFAEHRVRAIMNRYPDERDPQVLCASIVNEL